MTLALFCFDFLSRSFLQLVPSFPYILINLIIVVMPTCGYWDQARMMITLKDPTIYAKNTALILVSFSLLKITFWFDEPFALKILGQCYCLLFVALVQSYFHFKYLNTAENETKPHFNKGTSIRFPTFLRNVFTNPKQASKIYSAITFEQFMTSLCFYYIIALIIYLILRVVIGIHVTVNIYSVIANIIESFVSLPAFMKIVVRGDIENVSMVLIGQYIFGDFFKLAIFKASNSPWPFFMGAFIQLFLDSILSIKYMYLMLKHRTPSEPKHSEKSSEALDDIPIKN